MKNSRLSSGVLSHKTPSRLAPFVALLAMALSSSALARCTLDGNTSNNWSDTITFNDADYVRDTAIGQSTTKYVRPGQTWPQMKCDWSNYRTTTTATIVGGELVPGYINTYKTGVDGIGVQFFAVAYGHENTREAPFIIEAASSGANQPISAAARLIVTGQVKTGKISALPTLRVEYKQGPYEAQTYMITVNAPIVITSKGCTLVEPDMKVNMPKGILSSLVAPGDTLGHKGFNINLKDCPADVKIYATLTDARNPSNRSDILSLSSDSTAKGVGFRVSHAGNAIKFGPNSAAPGTLNQFLITNAPTPLLSIPMEVSYIRTNEKAEGGTANGSIILNMSYQ